MIDVKEGFSWDRDLPSDARSLRLLKSVLNPTHEDSGERQNNDEGSESGDLNCPDLDDEQC